MFLPPTTPRRSPLTIVGTPSSRSTRRAADERRFLVAQPRGSQIQERLSQCVKCLCVRICFALTVSLTPSFIVVHSPRRSFVLGFRYPFAARPLGPDRARRREPLAGQGAVQFPTRDPVARAQVLGREARRVQHVLDLGTRGRGRRHEDPRQEGTEADGMEARDARPSVADVGQARSNRGVRWRSK